MAEKILDVKNLKVSFWTNNGTVKAVRDISFELERGRTLAIVGESGSGKSVTSKSILGILAGNAIIEGGEILYDGKDLLKIPEEEMCEIRGDKISMIFQDPLSALNPIVKIGRQITEAMLLKNKVSRKNARREFNERLALLKDAMIAAQSDSAVKAEISEKVSVFDKFNVESIHMENAYNVAFANAEELISDIEEFTFMVEKKQKLDYKALLKEMVTRLKGVKDVFMTAGSDDRIAEMTAKLENIHRSTPSAGRIDLEQAPDMLSGAVETLNEAKALMEELVGKEKPNFFRIGYYKLKNPGADLGSENVAELNEKARELLADDFMNRFISLESAGLTYSANCSRDKKAALLPVLEEAKGFFASRRYTKASAEKKASELTALVEDSIDRLELTKDSVAYTFGSSLKGAIEKYFKYMKQNPKEERRFERQTAKHDRMIAKGKTVDWKVTPKVVYDLDELAGNMVGIIENLIRDYEASLEKEADADMTAAADRLIDWFKNKASQVVYKVTKGMAKEKAIKLMEEVGIPEPRLRYNQYPFEFSGGMRQRIVIAIALAANPDILICDEPTTALDVTIQAQILELINDLKAERNLSVIFITHDLGVVANMADDIAVMYAGKIVEYGTAEDIFYDPRHPYTWALLASMPDLDTKEKLDAIPGTPPNMIYPPQGDAFADRNKYALQIDFEQQPPMFRISDTHYAATWLLHPDAPKVEMPRIISERIERMKSRSGGVSNG